MQIEHKQPTGTLLFVGLPNGANKIEIGFEPNTLEYILNGQYEFIDIPKGFELLSLSNEISEDVLANIMPSGLSLFADFTQSSDFGHKLKFDTAKESLQSLMDHLKIYTVNPFEFVDQGGIDLEQLQAYREAQERTFSKWSVLWKEGE